MTEVHEFFLEAGNLALDLMNTRPGAAEGQLEQLRSPRDLRTWLAANGLTEGPSRAPGLGGPPAWRVLLDEARQLREHVDRVVHAITHGEPPSPYDVFGINRVLAASRLSRSLVFEDDRAHLVEHETGASPQTALAPVAWAAADLVSSAQPQRLRQCDAPSCGRWFLDTSKGGRRKWCSMAECGNRAKARSHRRRLASA